MIIAPFAMILVIRWYVGATATAQFPTGERAGSDHLTIWLCGCALVRRE